MIYETNWMQQLWFINQPLAQHVSGTIMPILRNARPYITACGFQHLMCWLESWEAKCWKPYAVIYALALLKMGIMVPETCSANDWLINHNCCIKLVSKSFHIKDARSDEHQIWMLRTFASVLSGQGVTLMSVGNLHLAPRLKKEYVISLLHLWAFMAYSNVNFNFTSRNVYALPCMAFFL